MHLKLLEWQDAGPGTALDVPLLRGFHFDTAAERSLADKLSDEQLVEFEERYEGLRVRARSFVGRIRVGRLNITILPKLAITELLTLLRYAYNLRDIRLFEDAYHDVTGSLLQDLLVRQLADEVRVLLERGVARRYVPRSEELASPRGSIDFLRLAVRGPRYSTALPCVHHPRDTDHTLNRCVRAGLQHAVALTDDPELRFEVSRACGMLSESVTSVPLSDRLLLTAKRSLNRLVAPYASILHLIELLYQGCFIATDTGTGDFRIPGFLLDMNRFFQRLLERFLKDFLPDYLQLASEHQLSDMFRYLPDENPRNQSAPTPRPDFAIMQSGDLVALLDAKYRDLWKKPLPSNMLYQLSVYALSQRHGSTATILYPTTHAEALPARIEVRASVGAKPAAYVLPIRLVDGFGIQLGDGHHAAAPRCCAKIVIAS